MQRPDKIKHPAAWTGSDMAKCPESWTQVLTEPDITEIDAALRAFDASGADIGAITAKNFPLPKLTAKLQILQNELRSGRGFGLISGFPVERYSTQEACTIFCGIGAHLGSARSQNAMGHILGHVKDVGADPQDTNTRIYQTSARQTFHTDSADVVGLLCLKDAMEGGDSLLASTLTVYNRMMAARPDLAQRLFEPVATDRRGEVPEGREPYFMIPVLNWHEGALTGIYQRQYIESAQRFEQAPRLDPDYLEALDLFDAISNDETVHLCMRLVPGDMQFVYNHTNLHDRTGFRDWPDPSARRHLLRLWLALPEDRALPPVFEERYGSIEIGDRGGIVVPGTKLNVPLSP